MKYSYEYEAGYLSGSVAECHCVNRPSFFAGKNVSRRPSRPPNTPRGRHRAGRGHAECRRPRKRCLTCLLIDPRGRFRQLAARPRAIQTGSSPHRETPETALFSGPGPPECVRILSCSGVWLIAHRESDRRGGKRRPSKPPRPPIFCLVAPRTPRRAPEPGYLDAERKPGTSRIQRRVELKFWPKTRPDRPRNHFGTVSRYPAP